MIIICVSAGQREKALCVKQMGARNVNRVALKNRAPLKGVITGVAVFLKVNQLKGKIPGVCDARRLVRCRQRDKSGETEESLSALLSFDIEYLPDKVMLGCISYPVQAFIPNTLRRYRCQAYGHVAAVCMREVPRCEKCAEGHVAAVCRRSR